MLFGRSCVLFFCLFSLPLRYGANKNPLQDLQLAERACPMGEQALVISLSFPVILGHSVLEDFAVMMNWTISFIGEVTRYGLGGSAWSLDCSTSFVS